MTYSGTLCTEANVDMFTGAGVSASFTQDMKSEAVLMAEGYVCALSRRNWVSLYSGLTTALKRILSEYCARAAAVAGVAYSMAGYTSRLEAENMIAVHLRRMFNIETLLRDSAVVKFLGGGDAA